MKKLLIATVILMSNWSLAVAQTAGTVTVSLTEIEKQEGQLVFMLFNSSEGFPAEREKAEFVGLVENYEASAEYIFEKVPYGEYAVAVFQDKNGDGVVERNFIGFPKEPVGALNMSSMGKPSFSKSAFILDKSETQLSLTFMNQ